MGELSVLVPPQGEGQRLDKVLPELAQLSRAAVQALCQEGSVLVNGRPAGKSSSSGPGNRWFFFSRSRWSWRCARRRFPWILSTRTAGSWW